MSEGGVLMVTVPDPEESDRRDSGRHGGSDMDATDAEFANIIAQWRAEPDAPHWPADEDRAPESPHPVPTAPTEHRDGDGDHFEPPEPPPLPMPRPRTLGGMLLLAVGVLLLIQPGLPGLGETGGTALGLLVITAGIGWLVLGLRDGPPPEGWDDGARL
jgi:hypothetical protein